MSSVAISRKGRIRAFLAGGLVLGLGAAITLAAWNDSEFAGSTFTAGTFNLEGSATDGTAFTEHSSAATQAPLSFTLNPANLSPGDIVYAPFAVRLAAGTTNDAIVTLSSADSTGTGTFTGLTVSVIQSATFECDDQTTGTSLVSGAALPTTPAGATFNLDKGANSSTAGASVNLCFIVTAGSGLVQGQTGSVTWEFNAVSQV